MYWNRALGPLGSQIVLYAMRIYTKGAWKQEEINNKGKEENKKVRKEQRNRKKN